MSGGYWASYTLTEPGKWFHGWKLPLPSYKGKKKAALPFEYFHEIVVDLNKDKQTLGCIGIPKAQELYYHFLIQHFPKDPLVIEYNTLFPSSKVTHTGMSHPITNGGNSQASILHRRQVKPEEIDPRRQTMVAPSTTEEHSANREAKSRGYSMRDGSYENTGTVHRRTRKSEYSTTSASNNIVQRLLSRSSTPIKLEDDEEQATSQKTPPQHAARRVRSNKSIDTIHRRSGESESSDNFATEQCKTLIETRFPIEDNRVTGDVGPPVVDSLPGSYCEQLQMMVAKEQGTANGAGMEASDSGVDMIVDSPPAADNQIAPEGKSRLKRKSSTDDTADFPETDINPRPAKRNKSDSNHSMKDEEAVDKNLGETVAKLSRLRGWTDTELHKLEDMEWMPSTQSEPEVLKREWEDYPLNEVNLQMIPESSKSTPVRLKEEPKKKFFVSPEGKKSAWGKLLEDDEQVATWWKLVEAISNARNALHGEELELFQQLVGKAPKRDKQVMILKWKRGEKSGKVATKSFDTPKWNKQDEEMEGS